MRPNTEGYSVAGLANAPPVKKVLVDDANRQK